MWFRETFYLVVVVVFLMVVVVDMYVMYADQSRRGANSLLVTAAPNVALSIAVFMYEHHHR